MNNPKILLTILPVFWPNMPPLGLACLQSYCVQNGIAADILDCNNIFYNKADAELQSSWRMSCNNFLEENIISVIMRDFPAAFQSCIETMLTYEIIGFSCFKSNLRSTLEVIKIIKVSKPSLKIVLGGPEITRQYFKTHAVFDQDLLGAADLLVAGEGEKSFLDFVSCSTAARKIASFVQLDDLSMLLFPRYNGLDFAAYPKSNAAALLFSRGCIRNCHFCSEKLLFKGFRSRPVKSMIDEITYHKNKGIKYFVFYDSFLNADLKQLEALCDAIIASFGFLPWEAQMAIRDDMDERLMRKVKQSGCYNLFIGFESGSDKTLERMNKGFSSQQAERFFRKLHDAGLFFGISIIVGYPGESEADFTESLEFVVRNKGIIPKVEQVNPFTYYDGTCADASGDYTRNPQALKRMDIFVREIKRNNFKFTNAFLGNLIEKGSDG
ncbi:MAG: radical SAM protein [Candidatus Omnitrophota bacterium]|jgi:hypothetical protein